MVNIKEVVTPFLLLGMWFCVMVLVMIPSVYVFEYVLGIPNNQWLIWVKLLAILGWCLLACAMIALPCFKIFEWFEKWVDEF